MKRTSWSSGLTVTADGTGVVAHAGSVAVRLLADRVGLTGGLSSALARRSFTPVHGRGQVLVDVAVMLAAGGEAIGDIDTLRHQGQVLGPVASAPTVWRALDELTPARLRKVDRARVKTRASVWARLPGGRPPASAVAGTHLPQQVVVLDVDATIVIAHSEKEQARATFKRTFGFHPIGVWGDNTGELLAMKLRPGNANANDSGGHVQVLTEAIAQLPATQRKHLLVRADGAGASRPLLVWLTGLDARPGRTVEYSVGFPVNATVRDAISRIPAAAWQPALDADGQVRQHADVAEITGLLDGKLLARWPAGMRDTPAASTPTPARNCPCSSTPTGGATRSSPPTPVPGRWRSWRPGTAPTPCTSRVEDRIRHAKDTGLGRLPSREFGINQAWLTAVAIAADLIAWLRLLALPESLSSCEPKALRYRVLHVPARLVHGSRRRRLRLPATWPWAAAVVATFTSVLALAPG